MLGSCLFDLTPSPRTTEEQARVWRMIRQGTLDVVSSDHCGFSFEGTRGKRQNGSEVDFTSCLDCEHRTWEQGDDLLSVDRVLTKAQRHR